MRRFGLFALVIIQTLTHLFWLSPAVHSGQLAIPWMMLRGRRLFAEIWEQHAPGSSLIGAAAQALLPGIDPALLIKLLNILLVISITLLVHQLAQRLSGRAAAGLLAALVWAWWEPVYGNILLYFDTLLALAVLAALAVYLRRQPPTRRQILLSGLLMGAATLFKQQAWLAVGLFGLWLLVYERRRQFGLLYAAAALALPLLQWLVLAAQGLWDGYVFWNWSFNLAGFMDGVPLDGDFFRKLLLSNLLVLPFVLLVIKRGMRHCLILPLMWLAGLVVLYPRFGEIHAMGHLPFTAVMSGMVLAWLADSPADWRSWDVPRTVTAGLAAGIGIGWLWTGAASHIPTAVGSGKVLAYDEFRALVQQWQPQIAAGDTLFVLPETDSTPQFHPLTGMLPPPTWVKGWRWYFRPAFVLEALQAEWETNPPTWVLVFPDLAATQIEGEDSGIQVLLDIVAARYRLAFTSDADIYWHGPARVYRLDDAPPASP